MDIQERITRQRVKHIVDSYRLDGDAVDTFADYLSNLLETYPQSLVELALTEAIVKGWSEVPMRKGLPFIHGVHDRLRAWHPDPESPSQRPSSFQSPSYPKVLGATSVDVRAANPSPIDPESIETALTPEQFEQITGLDSSLVFDDQGKVLIAYPTGTIKPLEPR